MTKQRIITSLSAKTNPTDLSEIQKSYSETFKEELYKGISLLNYEPKDTVNDLEGINSEIFIDQLIEIVKLAHDLWKLKSQFKNVTINFMSAIGPPGCLDGPTLISRSTNIAPLNQMTGTKIIYAKAVLEGVSANFKLWQDAVTIPGLPWYPSFAAFPGPMAPPTPNMPFPLITCSSNQIIQLVSPAELETAIQSSISDTIKNESEVTFVYVLAVKLSLYFTTWLSSQMVKNVMGTGPVPIFAPPRVNTGPVRNGYILPNLGILAH